MAQDDAPAGVVPLATALEALRAELKGAYTAAQGDSLRFEPSPVELTLQVAVTAGGKANAGVKWWLISAGGEVSREKITTQTVRLTLQPRLFDADGKPVDFLIDADDKSPGAPPVEIPLDAPA
jgi:hypothetical protein